MLQDTLDKVGGRDVASAARVTGKGKAGMKVGLGVRDHDLRGPLCAVMVGRSKARTAAAGSLHALVVVPRGAGGLCANPC
jgi:hypothetical protein